MFNKISNECLLTVFLLSLALRSATSLGITTKGNLESKFKVVDIAKGTLSKMSTRFADGRFDVVNEVENIGGEEVNVVYATWTPKPDYIFLCFTNGSHQTTVNPGDQVYFYEKGSFEEPLKVPVFAVKADKENIASAFKGVSAASRKMTLVTGLMGNYKHFAKTYPSIKFNKMMLKPWNHQISMDEVRVVTHENEEILSEMGADNVNKLFVEPNETNINHVKEKIGQDVDKAVTEAKANFARLFAATSNEEQKIVTDMEAIYNRAGKNIKKVINEGMADFWGNFNEYKLKAQQRYYTSMIHGKKNFLARIVKTAEPIMTITKQRMVDLIDGAIRNNVIHDKTSDELFDMLDELRAAVDEAIATVNDMSKSATTSTESKTGQRSGYYGIVESNKVVLKTIILSMKFNLSVLCFNQLKDIMAATQQYAQMTHQRHPNLDILVEEEPNHIKTAPFSFVFNRKNWENPAFFAYSSANAPFLSSSRRVLLVL